MRILTIVQQQALIEFEKLKFYSNFLEELVEEKCITLEEKKQYSVNEYKQLSVYYNLAKSYSLEMKASLSLFLLLCLLFEEKFYNSFSVHERLSSNVEEEDKFLLLVRSAKYHAKENSLIGKIPSWILEIADE